MKKVFNDSRNTESVIEVLKDYNIIFDETTLPVFINHMNSFIARVENNDVIQAEKSDYEMILDELSQESMDLATQIIDGIVEGTKCPSSMMEIVLVATHLETNKK